MKFLKSYSAKKNLRFSTHQKISSEMEKISEKKSHFTENEHTHMAWNPNKYV